MKTGETKVDNLKSVFGSNVRKQRERHGKKHGARCTQQELADFVGVDRAAISLLESGKNHPSLGLAVRIADYFGVTVDKLLKKGK